MCKDIFLTMEGIQSRDSEAFMVYLSDGGRGVGAIATGHVVLLWLTHTLYLTSSCNGIVLSVVSSGTIAYQ